MTDLNLGEAGKHLWPLFKLPFERLEKLNIAIRADTDGIKLNQLCPILKQLKIRLDQDVNYDFIDCELPKLERLDLNFSLDTLDRLEVITRLIKKNPQIRSVDIEFAPPELLKVIEVNW